MIINFHGFNSAGSNNAYAHLSMYFMPEIQVISEDYTVHHFSQGIQDIHQTLFKAGVVNHDGELITDQPLLFCGSSTGALYAEHFAKRYHGKVALINPLTDPWLLAHVLGRNTNFINDREYLFTRAQLNSFEALDRGLSTPRLIMVEKNDPVLDHRLTRKFYKGHGRYVEFNGNSHRFTFWDEALPMIRGFYLSK